MDGTRVSVTDEVVPIAAATRNSGDIEVVIRNRGAAAVDIGGDDVAAGAGFQLDAGDAVEITLESGDAVYGIAAESVTVSLHVLQRSAG